MNDDKTIHLYPTEDLDERNQFLRGMLGEHDCEVTFIKKDGTERIMPCTLRSEALPPIALTEHHQTRVYKPETLSVWCLDKQSWRSFLVANVQSLRVLP
jgi:hypothetical protein